MSIEHYDTTAEDTIALVEVYAGNAFNPAMHTDQAAIIPDKNWNPPRGSINYDFLFGYSYKITFRPSGTKHELHNLNHGNYSTSYIGFGESSHCVNSFSYTLDGNGYTQPQIGLGHSNMTGIGAYTVLVD